nr:MAG TPA: hypothetical protein [Caudoviricetes sp.]
MLHLCKALSVRELNPLVPGQKRDRNAPKSDFPKN